MKNQFKSEQEWMCFVVEVEDLKKHSKALEVILETIEFYGNNPSERNIKNGDCEYVSECGKKKCAVGRYLEDEVLNYDSHWNANGYDEFLGSIYDEGMTKRDVFKFGYDGIDDQIWDELQTFHDKNNHWTPEGLSKDGVEYALQMIKDEVGRVKKMLTETNNRGEA
jgi:hypothetical protein